MERSTNALAELAETIEEIKGLSVIRTMIHDEYTVALDKAQRIVKELAKVKIVRNQYSNEICWPTTGGVMDAFDKIIAIADEGAGDGK